MYCDVSEMYYLCTINFNFSYKISNFYQINKGF